MCISAPIPTDLQKPNWNISKNNNTGVDVLRIKGVDSLFFFLIPFFLNLSFVTRKYVDFHLWSLILMLNKYGLIFTPEGKAAGLSLKSYLNKRYTTDVDRGSIPDLVSIYNLLSNPLFDQKVAMTHYEITQKFIKSSEHRQNISPARASEYIKIIIW